MGVILDISLSILLVCFQKNTFFLLDYSLKIWRFSVILQLWGKLCTRLLLCRNIVSDLLRFSIFKHSFYFCIFNGVIVCEEGFNLLNLIFSLFLLERVWIRFMCPESGAEDQRIPPLFLSTTLACLATLFSQGHIPPCCVPLSPLLLCFFLSRRE